MANILGNMAYAQEGSYFKKEQEAELHKFVERLKKEGRLNFDSGNRSPPRNISYQQSMVAFEVLPEILQQAARLDVPRAALEQEFIRRVKGIPPPVTAAEFARWKANAGMAALNALAPTARVNLGRNKFAQARNGFEMNAAYAKAMSPEAKEAARREFMVAMRSLVYGSMVGTLGLVSLATFVCYRNGITSVDDMHQKLRAWASPMGSSAQEWMRPFQDWSQRAWGNRQGGGTLSTAPKPRSEFSEALRKKFNVSNS
ncbi:hypothetical protein BSKO_01022 [Bryopsis sp. KO-2023]|nr:hypothetical protein BSKO_01022 [Bryopsis sp. KO-2023]